MKILQDELMARISMGKSQSESGPVREFILPDGLCNDPFLKAALENHGKREGLDSVTRSSGTDGKAECVLISRRSPTVWKSVLPTSRGQRHQILTP